MSFGFFLIEKVKKKERKKENTLAGTAVAGSSRTNWVKTIPACLSAKKKFSEILCILHCLIAWGIVSEFYGRPG